MPLVLWTPKEWRLEQSLSVPRFESCLEPNVVADRRSPFHATTTSRQRATDRHADRRSKSVFSFLFILYSNHHYISSFPRVTPLLFSWRAASELRKWISKIQRKQQQISFIIAAVKVRHAPNYGDILRVNNDVSHSLVVREAVWTSDARGRGKRCNARITKNG